MRRKVVQHGPSTMTLSLPAKWVREHGIKKGDEIHLEEHDNGLFITSTKGRYFKEKHVDVSEIEELIPHVISSLYKRGLDELVVTFTNGRQLERVRDVLNSGCVGYEIVKEDGTQITIRKVSEVSKEEFKTVFRRLFYFMISIAVDGASAARSHDKEMYEKLILRDQSVNKLADFCRRVINKKGQREYSCETAIYHIVEQVEKMGDIYKNLNEALLDVKKPSDAFCTLYEDVNGLLRKFETLFFSFDLKEMERFIKECDRLSGHEEDETYTTYLLRSMAQELYNLRGPMLMLHL